MGNSQGSQGACKTFFAYWQFRGTEAKFGKGMQVSPSVSVGNRSRKVQGESRNAVLILRQAIVIYSNIEKGGIRSDFKDLGENVNKRKGFHVQAEKMQHG